MVASVQIPLTKRTLTTMKDLILKSARKHSSDYLSEKKMPDIDNYQMMPSPDSRNFSDDLGFSRPHRERDEDDDSES